MYALILTGFLLSLTLSSPASISVDSLLDQLEIFQRPDTMRVRLLQQTGEYYQNTKPAKAKYYFEEALRISRKIGFAAGEAQALLSKGTYFIKRGALVEAQKNTMAALHQFKRLQHQKGKAEAYKNLGGIAFYSGQYAAAENYFRQALASFQAISEVSGVAKCHANLGLVCSSQSNFTGALHHFFEALPLAETLGDQESIGAILSYIGSVYYKMEDFSIALSYQLKALPLIRATNNRSRVAALLNDIGLSYLDKQDYKKALQYEEEALALAQQLEDHRSVSLTLNNLGAAYEGQQDYAQALFFYTESLALKREIGEKATLPTTLRNIARVHQARGDTSQALRYAEESLKMAQEGEIKKELRGAYYTLSEIYAAQKKYALALDYYKQYTLYQDSILNEERTRQVAEMQARFDLAQKENQITTQQKEITWLSQNKVMEKKIRITLMAASLLLILLAIFIYSRYRLKRRSAQLLHHKNEEIQEKNEQIRQINQELEKRMLRAQMDPHFIFNSLSSIQHFITLNDKMSALKYLSKFSRLIRQVLENSVAHQIPIADEIRLLEYYLELESLRFRQKFTYVIEIDPTLDVYDTEIPFLLIQPYVENAIVHGLQEKTQGGKISIRLENHFDHILCLVEDNGTGRKKAMARNRQRKQGHTSRGMSVTQQRLALLNHDRAQKMLVNVIDLYEGPQAAGTRVIIFIPKTQTEELCSALSL